MFGKKKEVVPVLEPVPETTEVKPLVNPAAPISLTAGDLQAILQAVVAAGKQPTVIEQLALDKLSKEADEKNLARKDTAELQKQLKANDIAFKKSCSHSGGKPRHGYGVYVSDELGGYILCQNCRAVVRPENQRSHYPAEFETKRPDIIFNNALFNQMLQDTDATGIFA